MLSYYGSPNSAAAYAEAEPIGEMVYDGLGNPVGFLPFVSDIVRNIPIVGPLVSSILPGGGGPPAPPPPPPVVAPAAPVAIPPMVAPPGYPSPQLPGPAPVPFQPPAPWPLGWIRPPLPYTGLGPRRLYMRCAVWPGPQGLAPEYAAQMPPAQHPQAWQQWQPPMPLPAPGYPTAGFRPRRRFRRR